MRNFTATLSLGFLTVAAWLTLSLSGCKPDYPNCDSDKDCKEKEFCVERKCQQCRSANDCQPGFECNEGKCGAIAGYCTAKAQCPAGQECIANRCRACSDDAECPSGLICLSGQCGQPQCKSDDDCPQDKDCLKGRCVTVAAKPAAGPPCPLAPVYFGFNDAELSSEASNILAQNAQCLKKAERPVSLIGHADPRGTDEYNLALSDRRARSVKEYLDRLGIPSARLNPLPRGSIDAAGTDDASWSRDRRVDLEWQ